MDNVFTDLPLVGEPDDNQMLSTFVNRARTEAATVRNPYADMAGVCINLYLYGQDAYQDSAHVYPKIQPMINRFLETATANIPIVSLESVTKTDGGPTIVTTGGEAKILDAELVSQYFQNIYDVCWKKSRGDRWYRLMAFYGKILGWQDSLTEWDPISKCPKRRIIPALQWYKDPLWEDLDEMAYVGLDWPLDAEEAKRMFPSQAEHIDNVASRSIQYAPGSQGYSSLYTGQNYARPMVTISPFWIRNRKAMMTDIEAIQAGLVEAQQVPVEGIPNEAPQDAAKVDSTQTPSIDGQSGIPSDNVPPVQPQQREALYLVATGQEVTVGDANWPQKLVLSETVQIQNKIVSDEICPSWDIPVCTNFNVQIPRIPYGQSDCIRVRTLQNDRNTIHAATVKNATYNSYPSMVWPKSIKDDMPEEMRNMGLQPGMTYFMDDETLKMVAAYIKPIAVPDLPSSLVQVAQELDAAFDNAGGQSAVQQGQAPTSNASGELANALLAQGQATTSYSFQYLEEMMYRSAKLDVANILKYMTPQDLIGIDKTYDIMTTELILNTARTLEFDINIEQGGMKAQEDANTRNDFAIGLIDEETALDRLGYDSKVILARKQAALAAQMQSQQLNGTGGSAAPAGNDSPPHKFRVAQPA